MGTPSASAICARPLAFYGRLATLPTGGLAMLVDALRQHAAATSRPSSRRRQRRRRPRQVLRSLTRPAPRWGRMRARCSSPSSPPSSALRRTIGLLMGVGRVGRGHRGHRTGGPRRCARGRRVNKGLDPAEAHVIGGRCRRCRGSPRRLCRLVRHVVRSPTTSCRRQSRSRRYHDPDRVQYRCRPASEVAQDRLGSKTDHSLARPCSRGEPHALQLL
jgi:hypothetical protein